MVKGAAEGYERSLELVGTGYRAEVKGKQLVVQVGFSHPTSIELPSTISAVVPPDSKGTMIVLTSADKELLGRFAATVRDLRPPEPYGGKGIRYRGEVVEAQGRQGRQGQGQRWSWRNSSDGSAASSASATRSRHDRAPAPSVFRSGRHIYAQVVLDGDGEAKTLRRGVDACRATSKSQPRERRQDRRRQEGRRADREDLPREEDRQGRLRPQRLPLSRAQ